MSAGADRLFLASVPPREFLRPAMDRATGLDLSDCRAVPAERIHLTWMFLGNAIALQDMLEVRFESALGWMRRHPPPVIAPVDIRLWPGPGVVVWYGETDRNPASWWRRWKDLWPEASRTSHSQFRPHLTLARCRRGSRDRTERILAECRGEPWRPDRLILFSSTLTPQGPRYSRVAEGSIS